MFSTLARSFALLSRRELAIVVLFSLGTLLLAGLDILGILMVASVASLAFGGVPTLSGFLPASLSDEQQFLVMLGLAGLLFFSKSICGLILARRRASFLATLEVKYSDLIARQVFYASLSALKAHTRSHLEWAILRSTSIAFGKIIGKTLVLVAETLLAIAIIGLFFYVDMVIAIAVLLYFAAIVAVFQIFTRRRVASSGRLFSNQSISVNQAIADTVSAFREISVLSRTEHFLRKIHNGRLNAARHSAYFDYISSVPRLIVESALILGALVFVGIQLVLGGDGLDFSLISVFIVGSLRLMSSLLPIQNAAQELRYYAGQAEAAQLLVEEAAAKETATSSNSLLAVPQDSVILGHSPFDLELRSVWFAHGDAEEGEFAVRDLSLEAPAGSTVALIGPSGAGKSTIVDLILGLHKPSSGIVNVGGQSPQMRSSFRPGSLAYVPQKPGLISGSILENITLGMTSQETDPKLLQDAIMNSELDELIRELPEGIHTNVGNHVDSFSGGQLQRIGLARALYAKPCLLVLDETTSNLDVETESAIGERLSKLKGQFTTVMIAHRLSTIQDADIVFMIDNGQLIGQGTLSELVRTVPRVARYVALMEVEIDESR